MLYRFACNEGSARLEYDEAGHTSSAAVLFKCWGWSFPAYPASTLAGALKDLASELSFHPEAAPIVEQIRCVIDGLKQGDLFPLEEERP